MHSIKILFFLYVLYALPCFSQEAELPLDVSTSIEHEIKKYSDKIDSLKYLLAQHTNKTQPDTSWKFRFKGVFGLNLNKYMNWAGRGIEDQNASSSSILTSLSGELKRTHRLYVWQNEALVHLGWQKLSQNEEHNGYQKTADLLNVTSHLISNPGKRVALSTLGEWRSHLLHQSITPSYIDWSVGVTWTPNKFLVAVLHPVNYELVLSDEQNYQSSLGGKLVATYDREITTYLHLKSKFSGFLSYEELDNFSNYTWTNGINLKLLNNIGLGVEYALRVSPQETSRLSLTEDYQSYVVMGLSYALL